LDFDDDALRPCHQSVVETRIKCAVSGNGSTNADHRYDHGGCTKNEERHLAASARQERLYPLTPEVIAERHGYFAFGASANR
jgi:hypothetical protein